LSDSTTAREPESLPYYDASQFRLDTWNELKRLTARLERSNRTGADVTEMVETTSRTLASLVEIEHYFAFPGQRACRQVEALHRRAYYGAMSRYVERLVRLLVGDLYRRRDVSEIFHEDYDNPDVAGAEVVEHLGASGARPYFEVIVVDDTSAETAQETRKRLLGMRRDQDQYVYDVVVVRSLEDAVIAAQFNYNIQSVVIRYSFATESLTRQRLLRTYLAHRDVRTAIARHPDNPAWALGESLQAVRPELDLYLVTDDPLRNVAGHTGRFFRRVFYHEEDYLELHLTILRGIHERYETPFFNALREYSHRPTGVFHAMPISRGKSIYKSHWIRDMGEFYGENIFLAETSATTGGLDSLLQPHGPIKSAQEKVARAFGSHRSFFVTNGTSTANKIVVQALLSPGDIALVSRDCHKSHHYALVLAGADPVYMDPYPLRQYTMYGAVTIREIKRHLLDLKREGKLDRVRMLLLTNCTFDGVIYNPYRVMAEVLAIKPDMVFVWDEAWYGFAYFSPGYRQRCAMASARRLRYTLESPEYRVEYDAWRKEVADLDLDDPAVALETRLMPDPDASRVRCYATQSTHKTLTSLRQGSMIHVYDLDYGRVAEAFEDAYMTHTSTSPNYQIIASLDVGRRQVELEGYEFVQQSVALAMTLRERVQESPELAEYFQVLKPRDLVPAEHRPSGLEEFYRPGSGYQRMGEAFESDEFVLDPTRVTIGVGLTGMDGDTLRSHLMNKYDIQINKTSRNTVLFMFNIGTTRGAVAYLLEVLSQIARELCERRAVESDLARKIDDDKIDALTKQLPPLPNFSRFHGRFSDDASSTIEGDLRAAYFLGRQDSNCDFLRLDGEIQASIAGGRELVSAGFVTPYPPGFPVLVPGQVVSSEILEYLCALDVKEIHGYHVEFGLRVFKQALLTTTVAQAAQ
jgi:arginine decarboxylase